MKCEFTYIKMKRSEHVEEHVHGLMNKLMKLTPYPLRGHFTFSQEKYNHCVSVTLSGKNVYFKSEAIDENFYVAIEEAIDRVGRQLNKKKNKMKSYKNKRFAKELNNVVYLDEYRRLMERRKSG